MEKEEQLSVGNGQMWIRSTRILESQLTLFLVWSIQLFIFSFMTLQIYILTTNPDYKLYVYIKRSQNNDIYMILCT